MLLSGDFESFIIAAKHYSISTNDLRLFEKANNEHFTGMCLK